MPSKTSDNLASFVRQLDAETLATVLIELAADHAVVHERLVRLPCQTSPRRWRRYFARN